MLADWSSGRAGLLPPSLLGQVQTGPGYTVAASSPDTSKTPRLQAYAGVLVACLLPSPFVGP